MLSIGSALLGAQFVVGIDVDSAALRIAKRNHKHSSRIIAEADINIENSEEAESDEDAEEHGSSSGTESEGSSDDESDDSSRESDATVHPYTIPNTPTGPLQLPQ